VKVDAHKIKEIARKLGVSERTVEEYLLDRLTLQTPHEPTTTLGERAFPSASGRARARAEPQDRFETRREEDAG